MRTLASAVALAAAFLALPAPTQTADGAARALRAEVVSRIPHDAKAFTQGLVFAGTRLYESTGLYGDSSVRELDPRTGRVRRLRDLPPREFGEGLAAVGSTLVQLTWREGIAHRWDARSFRPRGSHAYAGEGWGLCFDGRRFVQSDGSSWLTFRDPQTFARRGRVQVTLAGDAGRELGLDPGRVARLNELECRGGRVYANVFGTDAVVVVEPAGGRVEAVVDASGLPRPAADGRNVLNGIAYDPTRRAFLLTGKLWPSLYEVRLVPR